MKADEGEVFRGSVSKIISILSAPIPVEITDILLFLYVPVVVLNLHYFCDKSQVLFQKKIYEFY